MGRISASGQDKLARADQLRAAIAILEQEIQQILAFGKVAPPGCRVMRYQVRRKKGCYWYYKLQALEPTFPTGQDSEKLRGVQTFRKSWQFSPHRCSHSGSEKSQS